VLGTTWLEGSLYVGGTYLYVNNIRNRTTNVAYLRFNLDVTGTDNKNQEVQLRLDDNTSFGVRGTGDGAGGVTDLKALLYYPLDATAAGADISLGANKLKTTNLLLRELDSNTIACRTLDDTAFKNLHGYNLVCDAGIISYAAAGYFKAANTDGAYTTFEARDTAVGLAEAARLQGANWAHLLLTRARFGTTALTADADHRGGLYVEEGGAGVADKLYWIAKNSLDGYEAVQVAIAS
jgi:hypothetical protein